MRERARWKEHEHNLTWAFQFTYSNIFNKYATYVTAFFFPLVTNEKLKVAALVRKHQHTHTQILHQNLLNQSTIVIMGTV